jgi:hypothetical protein
MVCEECHKVNSIHQMLNTANCVETMGCGGFMKYIDEHTYVEIKEVEGIWIVKSDL